MSSEIGFRNLIDAAALVQSTHTIDTSLVREGAEKHGVNISDGVFFQGMEWGAYNKRMPDTDEYSVRRLSNVKGIAKFCMDYRQSAPVASLVEREGLVAWTDAGGPAQPESRIIDVDMTFWDAVIGINPDLTATLLAHLEVCGGANHYSNGKIKQLRETAMVGEQLEKSAIHSYVKKYASELRKVKRDIDIKIGLVEIVSGGKFDKISWM